jgi:hypothetical protein
MALLAGSCGGGHPKDALLLENFSRNRADLERLVAMFQADKGLGRVGRDFTRPEDPSRVRVSTERVQEYRRLCMAVGANDCIEGYDRAFDALYGAPEPGRKDTKDPIWIHVSSIGLSISGSSKGYLYSNDPDFEQVPDLDVIVPKRSNTWLRHIEGPWFLYYDYED